MDQNSNNSPNDFLWSLLANPADDVGSYTYNVHRLVNDFPQSGILQALLAHTSEQKNLKRASTYFSPRTLFKLINAPTTFTDIADERIFIQPGISIPVGYRQKEPSVYEESQNSYTTESHTSEDLVVDEDILVETAEEPVSHHELEDLVVDHNAEGYLNHPTGVDEEQPGHDELDELVVDHNADEYLTHPAEEEHNTQTQDEEVRTPETEHHGDHVVTPVEEETYERTEHHVEHEAIPGDEHTFEHVEPNAEYEFTPAPDAIIEEFESHVNEPLTAEEHSETEAHDHIADEEAERHEDFASPEVAHHEEAEEPVHEHEAIHIETEEHKETPVEFAHTPEEAVHFDHGHVEEVDQHEAAHEVEPFAESELPEQTIDHEEEQDQPAPFIELAEEESHTIAPEIPVEEEIAPEAEVPVSEEIVPEPPAHVYTESTPVYESPVVDDSDEIYDEIVSIEDINLDRQQEGQRFSFDEEFGAHEDEVEKEKAAPAAKAPETAEAGLQDVSKYHDEKMPYTFMWWLDKTRKEHEQAYQPYIKPPVAASAPKPKKITDELQQQYFENIFHITSIEELDKNAPPPPFEFGQKKQEQVIIDRFIKEEPQIKPQSSDKLDNENKAKKSSEDRDELVSETLATIYSEQMLYHKAIASYKKLILKYPEKSRYFADKIEQLEKKTN